MWPQRRLLALPAAVGALAALAASAGCTDRSSCPSKDAHLPGATMQAALQDIEHPGQSHEVANMLQRHAAARRDPVAPPELAKVLPLAWFHVPKCGTSFINTIVHIPGVCPTVPQDVFVNGATFNHYDSIHWLDEFCDVYNLPDSCPGLHDREFGHLGMADRPYKELEGKWMMMLRNPEQRIIAAYKDLIWATENEPIENVLADWRSWGGLPNTTVPHMEDFIDYASGCTARMLTRGGHPCGGAGGPPTDAEMKLAVKRIQTGFSFIGLTDDWELSMCLFHAIFNVECFVGMFMDDRQTRPDHTVPYDTAPLMGKKDVYDDVLYKEAKRWFHTQMKNYNVSEESCWDTCWRPAGLEGIINRTKKTETLSVADWMDIISEQHY